MVRKVIESSVGNRLVRVVTIVDVKRWFRLWRTPKLEGGEPRVSRAHDAVHGAVREALGVAYYLLGNPVGLAAFGCPPPFQAGVIAARGHQSFLARLGRARFGHCHELRFRRPAMP